MKDLVEFSRFEDYLNQWFVQTHQMEAVQVLYMNLERGTHQLTHNCSYLSKQFFDEYPAQKPGGVDLLRSSFTSSNEDDFI